MRCPTLPNWGFKKDGSCGREGLCSSKRIQICKFIRQSKASEYKKLATLRNKLIIKLHSIDDPTKQLKTKQGLELVETQIATLLKS